MHKVLVVFAALAMLAALPMSRDARAQVASLTPLPRYVAGEVAIKLPIFADSPTIAAVERSYGLREIRYIDGIRWHIYSITDGMSAVDKADELMNSPMIEDAEAIGIGTFDAFPATPPNDPKYPTTPCPCPGLQWGLPNSNVLQAWQIAGGGNASKAIGILDTGVDIDHTDLGTIGGGNFTHDGGNRDDVCTGVANHPFGHGTAVAGVAAAFTNNGHALAGVAYNAAIWSLRISRNCTDWQADWFSEAVHWAVDNGVWVLNASLDLTTNDPTKINLITDAIQYAWDHNVPVVAAVGNAGNDGFSGTYPATSNLTIRVGGTELKSDGTTHMWSECISTEYCQDAGGTNYGSPGIDVAAAADQLVLHKPGGGTYYSTNCLTGCTKGTSFAAPLVSGVVFLIRSRHPTWTVTQIRDRLRNTADKRFAWNGTNGYNYSWNAGLCGGQSKELGCGVVDAASAVQ